MQIYSKHIFLPDKEVEGYLTVENGKITGIKAHADGEYLNHEDDWILPGYLDIHIHGWGRGSFWMERTQESLLYMQQDLPKAGVTSFLATTCADSIPHTLTCLRAANQVYQKREQGAELLGVHLEGPFINPEFGGMQEKEYCIAPDMAVMHTLYDAQEDATMIKLMSIAPEMDNAKDVIMFCKDHQIQCNIGHSAATFDQIKELKGYGLGGVTHMFSGMKGLHHRELGVAGSAMYFEDLVCEFAKQTGMTVRHEAFDIVYRLKGSDKVYLTTDCAGYAKVTEPHYHYIRKETFYPADGLLKIKKDSGEEYTIDPLDYEAVKEIELSYELSVQNMAAHSKVTPFDVIRMTSYNPARHIGVLDRKGSLEIGKDADIIICDSQYQIQQVYCKGVRQR